MIDLCILPLFRLIVTRVTLYDKQQVWLDGESTYRLTLEKVKDAKKGATYAEESYEKWEVANEQAKKDLDHALSAHAAERAAMEAEKGLIKEIMAFVEAALSGNLGLPNIC